MKTLTTLLLICLTLTVSIAQEQDIETKSVALEDFISFTVDNFEAGNTELKNLTFLIQVHDDKLNIEDLIILRQSFKIISERLTENDRISIVAYSKFNGLALGQTSPKELKLIQHTLSDLKASIAEFHHDGMELAYSLAEENYIENGNNSIVMIRMKAKAKNEVITAKKEVKENKKNKRDAFIVAAIGLLPELINVIKK